MISNKNKQQYNKRQYKNVLYNNKQYGGAKDEEVYVLTERFREYVESLNTSGEVKTYLDEHLNQFFLLPAAIRTHLIQIIDNRNARQDINVPASQARRDIQTAIDLCSKANYISEHKITLISSEDHIKIRDIHTICDNLKRAYNAVIDNPSMTITELSELIPSGASDTVGETHNCTSINVDMINSYMIKDYDLPLYIDEVILINYIDYDPLVTNPITFNISEPHGKPYKSCVINWVSKSLREYYNKLEHRTDLGAIRRESEGYLRGGATADSGTPARRYIEPPKAYAKISFKRIMDMYIQDQTEEIRINQNISLFHAISELTNKICSNEAFNQTGNTIEAYKTVIRNLYKKIIEICREKNPTEDIPNFIEFDIIYEKLFSQPGDDKIINYRNFIMYSSQILQYLYIKRTDGSVIQYLPIRPDNPNLRNSILTADTNYSVSKIYELIQENMKNGHDDHTVELYIIYPYIQDSNIFNEIKESENPPADNNLTFNNEDNTPIIDGQTSKNIKKIEHKITNMSTINDYYNIFVNYELLESEPRDVPVVDCLNKICKDLISKKDDCLDYLLQIISEDPLKHDNFKKIIDYFNELEYSDIENNINNADSLVILFILHYIFKFKIYIERTTNINKLQNFDMWITNIQNYDKKITEDEITSIKNNSKLQTIFEKMHKKVPLNILNDNEQSFKLHRKYNTKKQPPEYFVRKIQIGKFEDDEQTGGVSKLNSTFKNSINQQLYNINNILKVNTHVIKQMGGQSSPDFINKIENEMDKYLQLSVKLKPLLQIILPYTSEDQTQFKKGIQTIENNEKIIKQIIKIFLYYKKLKLSEPTYIIPLQDDVFMDENKRSTLYNTLKLKLQDTKNITSSILYEFKRIIS